MEESKESIVLAIKCCQNIAQIDNLFLKMSAEEQINLPVSLVFLQESTNHDICEYGMVQSLKLTEEQIFNNFLPLLESKSSKFQAARDLVGQILNRLSTEKLAEQFPALISSLRSEFYFVSSEAERLIDSIEIKLLFNEYNALQRLQNDDHQDVRRVANKLLVKMMLAWPIEIKICRQKQITKWNNLEGFREACILVSLQVAQFWSDNKIVNNLGYFIKHTKSDDFVASELAAKLALKALLLSPVSVKQEHIKYVTSFHYFGNVDLRRKFRLLALNVLTDFTAKELSKFFNFLMQCQEAKDLEVCLSSWVLLSKINPNDLVIEDLVNWQIAGTKGPKRAARVLASKISPERLEEKLDYFIDCQKSPDADIRDLTSKLALRVSRKYLQKRHDYLMYRLSGTLINPKYLLIDLLRKADVGFTFSEKLTHWLYWKIQSSRA